MRARVLQLPSETCMQGCTSDSNQNISPAEWNRSPQTALLLTAIAPLWINASSGATACPNHVDNRAAIANSLTNSTLSFNFHNKVRSHAHAFPSQQRVVRISLMKTNRLLMFCRLPFQPTNRFKVDRDPWNKAIASSSLKRSANFRTKRSNKSFDLFLITVTNCWEWAILVVDLKDLRPCPFIWYDPHERRHFAINNEKVPRLSTDRTTCRRSLIIYFAQLTEQQRARSSQLIELIRRMLANYSPANRTPILSTLSGARCNFQSTVSSIA